MKRHWKVVSGSLTILALVLTGLWLARLTLAESLLSDILSVWLKADHFSVSELTFNRLVIRDLKAPDVSLARLEARFSLASLLDGRLENLALEGAHYRLEQDESESASGSANFPAFPVLPDLPPLPPIQVENSSITLKTALGPATITISGNGDGQVFVLSGNAVSDLGVLEIKGSAVLEDRRIVKASLQAYSSELSWQGKALGPVELEASLGPTSGLHLSLTLASNQKPSTLRLLYPEIGHDSSITLESNLELRDGEALTSLVSSFLPFTLQQLALQGSASVAQLPWDQKLPQNRDSWKQFIKNSGFTANLKASSRLQSFALVPGMWRADLLLTADGDQITFDADLAEGNESSRLTVSGKIETSSDRPRFDLAGSLASQEGGALQRSFAPYLGSKMELDGNFTAQGLVNLETPIFPTQSDPVETLGRFNPDIRLIGSIKNMEGPGIGPVSGSLDLALSGTDKLISIDILPDTLLSFSTLPAYFNTIFYNLSTRTNFTPPTEPFAFSGPINLKVVASQPGGFPFEFTSKTTLTDAQGLQLSIRGPVQGLLSPKGSPLSLASDALQIAVSGISGLPVSVHTLTYDGAIDFAPEKTELVGVVKLSGASLDGLFPINLVQEGQQTHIKSTNPGSFNSGTPFSFPGVRISIDKALNIKNFSLLVDQGALQDLTFSATTPSVRLSGNLPTALANDLDLKISMADGLLLPEVGIGTIQLPDQRMKVDDLYFRGAFDSANLARLAPGKEAARMTLGAVTHPTLTGSAALDLRFSPQPDGKIKISGDTRLIDGQIKLPLSGTLFGDYSRLSLNLPNTSIAFAKTGLQPAAISPLLAKLREVDGSVALTASANWNGKSLSGKGTLTLKDLALRYADMPIRGLNGTVSFRDLLNLATDGDQELALARFDPGLPLTDLRLVFAIEPAADSKEPVLLLKEARAESLLGPLSVTDGIYSLMNGNGSAALSFTRLDLSALAELIDVEGLQVTGLLAGSIPLALTDGLVTVSDANLEDTEVGTIRYSNETTRQALAGGGESVSLMLDALEDFQYNDLQVRLKKPNDKELVFSISLEGKNPNVLDGYPFRLNFNLTTDPTSLLAALRQGTSIGELLLKRSGRYSLSPP